MLIGRTGQVAWELQRSLAPLGALVVLDRLQLDLTDATAIRRVVRQIRPAVIVNAAAYTNVDGAEDDGVTAFAINASAPRVMAEEARDIGATLVHYSTDYVFDGKLARPYTELDLPAPINEYGRSKLAGEQAIRAIGCAHLILRTSWVYAARGRNFVRTILRLAAERDAVRVVDDQIGAPTWARFIAEATAAMLWRVQWDSVAREWVSRGEMVHLANDGATSWFGLAKRAIEMYAALSGRKLAAVEPIPSEGYPTRAARPRNSRLDLSRLIEGWGITAPPWQESLALCIEELVAQERAATTAAT
ncbi:MAG: dTDP-4-dehydrorhamnose reductase [Gammaproteobacteria bacterium]|nr:dTDP-4-dehydrorhamnose reductase [Gammaproteobacteria bacterium]